MVGCSFCGRAHRSAFFDVIEEEILACRQRVKVEDQGRLETWKDFGSPIKVEVEAFRTMRSEPVADGP